MRIAAVLIPIAASGVMFAQQHVERSQTIQMRVAGQPLQTTTENVFMARPATPLQVAQFSRTMKGAPYSAESITESVQVLADGNRIVTKSTSKSWRDSEGRMRMENNISPVGMWVPEGKNITLTTIDDPTTGNHYTFNNGDRTATKFTMHRSETNLVEGKQITISSTSGAVFAGGSDTTPARGFVSVLDAPSTMVFHSADAKVRMTSEDVKHEDLGQKNIEGVICDGVRDTITIAAGAMGNERPIEIVTERWTSKELGMDILRKHTDPRSGETTFRVQNLVRGEQPRNLFELPADVKVEEINSDVLKRKIEVKMHDKSKNE